MKTKVHFEISPDKAIYQVTTFHFVSLALVAILSVSCDSNESSPTLNALPIATPTPTIISNLQPSSDGSMNRPNSQGTGVYSGSTIPSLPVVLWRYPLQAQPPINTAVFGRIGSTPAVADGLVYVGGSEYLHAIDVGTGTQRWVFGTPGGRVGSVAIASGKVYFASGDQYLHVLDAKTGIERWKFTAKDGHDPMPLLSNPVVVGGVVYLGDARGRFYALDAENGRLIWQQTAMGAIVYSALVADGLVYFGTDGDKNPITSPSFYYALDAQSGSLVWRSLLSAPVAGSSVVEGSTIYFPNYSSGLVALDAKTGRLLWRYQRSNSVIVTAPTIAYNTVYVTLNHDLTALDARTGQERWNFQSNQTFLVAPSLVGNVLYCPTLDSYSNGKVTVSGALFSIEAHTGHLIWRFPIGGSLDSSVAVSDGVVFIISADDYLYALR